MGLEEKSSATQKGMPIYEDTEERSIVDALDDNQETPDWYPANELARKLWHCLEALRDIELALENASMHQDADRRRRQLKQFSVPLHSLAVTIVNLCNQVAGDADAKHWLDKVTVSQVSKIKTEFVSLVPIEPKSDLSVIRNRLGGHIDRGLCPWSAREILSRNGMSGFGRWLHTCIHALLDLMKLDVYAWSVYTPVEGQIRLMTSEPVITTILFSEERKEIVALHLAKRSPRMVIVDAMERIISCSQWMFESGQPRIGRLRVDDDRDWNTFRNSSEIWNRRPLGG